MMYFSEHYLSLRNVPKPLRAAVGGAAVGVMGFIYIVIFGWWLLHSSKPFAFEQYPMPAFFGDGYGVIRRLFEPDFYSHAAGPQHIILLLAFLCLAKTIATCLTLSSGGSGGIIAPSLFLGATAGGLLGVILQRSGLYHAAQPEVYAMVGMAAVLAAVVHAPLASILILADLTHDYKIVLPAMLATIIATGVARIIFRDSIYTLTLRLRGVRVGGGADLALLRRLNVEQIPLEPAIILQSRDPFQRIVDLISEGGGADFAVLDEKGEYSGMVTAEEIQTALIDREAVPLLLVQDVMRRDIPLIRSSDDLATALEVFSRHEVEHLPVCLNHTPAKVIGLLSRHAIMRRYQQMLQGA
jgi:CIC family chloride channel protein